MAVRSRGTVHRKIKRRFRLKNVKDFKHTTSWPTEESKNAQQTPPSSVSRTSIFQVDGCELQTKLPVHALPPKEEIREMYGIICDSNDGTRFARKRGFVGIRSRGLHILSRSHDMDYRGAMVLHETFCAGPNLRSFCRRNLTMALCAQVRNSFPRMLPILFLHGAMTFSNLCCSGRSNFFSSFFPAFPETLRVLIKMLQQNFSAQIEHRVARSPRSPTKNY